jgi:hypothetical protein
MKSTFEETVMLLIVLLGLPLIPAHLGDIAAVLADICQKTTAEIQELTIALIASLETGFGEFMRNLLVSTQQISARDPDLSRARAPGRFQRHEPPAGAAATAAGPAGESRRRTRGFFSGRAIGLFECLTDHSHATMDVSTRIKCEFASDVGAVRLTGTYPSRVRDEGWIRVTTEGSDRGKNDHRRKRKLE